MDNSLPIYTQTADALRELFLQHDFAAFAAEDLLPSDMIEDAPVPAAVLLAMIERDNGLNVILTKRTEHLYHHPGQISFPGGRIEASDDDDIDAALRETEEEVGLAREFVDVIGRLPMQRTGTGFRISPVVGLVREGFSLKLDEFEVAETFELPLSYVINPQNHEKRKVVVDGRHREFYVLPYQGRFIWGATAVILVNFQKMLARFA